MFVTKFENIKYQSAFVRIIFFIVCLAVIWFPYAIAINFIVRDDPNLATIITMVFLFCDFIFLQTLFNKHIYQETAVFQKYGLLFNNFALNQLIKGLAIGFTFCWSLFITEALFGWIYITSSSDFIFKIVLEGFLSALGIALAEELVFRGWILYELEEDYSKSSALWISSILFAVAHFLKPIDEIVRTFITFPALLLLGLTLVLAKRGHQNYLTISIGIHAGLVWSYYILNVGNLIIYTNRVPHWVTGIDDNPIAGILGLIFLGILALTMQEKAKNVNT